MEPMRHSFGGSALDRHVFDFETDMSGVGDGGGDTAGVDVDSGATVDPAVEPSAAATEPIEAAAPEWAGPSREEWEQTQGGLNALVEMLYANQEQPQGQPEEVQLPEFDPFSDNPGEQLASLIGTLLDQRLNPVLGPLQADREQQQYQQGYTESLQLIDSFGDLPAKLDDDGKDMAFTLAQPLFQQYRQQYGNRPGLAEAALKQTAGRLSGMLAAERKRGEEAYVERMRQATGGQGDLPVTGAALEGTAPANSYDEVISRWDSRQRHNVEALQT